MSPLVQDLRLSIQDADGRPLTTEPDYALLVTFVGDPSKDVLSITPRYADGAEITDADVSWSCNSEEVASLEHATTRSMAQRVHLKAPGTATIQLVIRPGARDQQSAALTIVVAPGVLMFGPDGRYYHLDASVWQAHPLEEAKVAEPVRNMIQRGSVLFTSAYLIEQPGEPIAPATTCYVINLASMSNALVAGVASAGSATSVKDVHRSHNLDRRQAERHSSAGAAAAMRAKRMPRPVTKR